MTFSQMQELLTSHTQLLLMHSDMLGRLVLGFDAFSTQMQESAQRHDREIAEIRLKLHEVTEKLDALIKIVDGIVGGKQ